MTAGWPQASASRTASPICVRTLDVVAPGAEQLREPVEARIPDVGADVPRLVEVPLVGLLRAPAVVVHHERDGGDPVAHRGLELLRVHQEAAVAVDGERRRLGAAELGPERRREGEAESAQVERGEKGAGPDEVEPVVAVGRRRAGVQRDDRVGRQRPPELGVDPLRLHGHGVERRLAEKPRLAPGPELPDLALPGLGGRAGRVSGERAPGGRRASRARRPGSRPPPDRRGRCPGRRRRPGRSPFPAGCSAPS